MAYTISYDIHTQDSHLILRHETYRKIAPLKILILGLEPAPGPVEENSMMNVYGKTSLRILMLTALVIAGCKDPDVSVGSLGKKYQAPAISGTNPFDQDMQTNGFVRFQGTCNPRVTDIAVSLDNVQFFIVPHTPPYAGTTLTGTEVNDASCEGDGQFDFYLTDADLTSWGFDPDDHVEALYLRGMSSLGETHILTLHDPSPSGGNGGTPGAPAKISLEKSGPPGFAGSSQCEYFYANVRDANNYTVNATSTVTFTLDKKVDSVLTSNIAAYTSSSDCVSSTNPQTTFTIANGSNSKVIYYRFPNTPLDGQLFFRAATVSLPAPTSDYTSVTLRDSSSGRYWITSYSPYKIAKGVCTPAHFEARLYSGVLKNLSSSSAWTPAVTGTHAAKLFFYTDASCSNQVAQIDGTGGNNMYYMKYIDATADTSTVELSIGHTVSVPTFGAYDDIVQRLQIDRTGNTIVSSIQSYTSGVVQRGVCTQMTLETVNSNGTPVVPNINVILGSSAPTLFYDTLAACGTNISPLTSLALITAQTSVYFKTTASPGSNQFVTISSAGIGAITRNFALSATPTTVSARFNSQPSFIYPMANVCTLMAVRTYLTDNAGDGLIYINNFGESKTLAIGMPPGYTLYTDAGCTTGASTQVALSVASGASDSGEFNFYLKADNTPIGGNFNVYQTTGGATGYLSPSSPLLILGP